jgi:hypothetical protein
MNFYNTTHRHHCGIDLHARSLYVCILNQHGETLLHKEIPAKPAPLLCLIEPYLDDLIIGVECMHCWYWLADFCEEHNIQFILVRISVIPNSDSGVIRSPVSRSFS